MREKAILDSAFSPLLNSQHLRCLGPTIFRSKHEQQLEFPLNIERFHLAMSSLHSLREPIPITKVSTMAPIIVLKLTGCLARFRSSKAPVPVPTAFGIMAYGLKQSTCSRCEPGPTKVLSDLFYF